MQHTRRNMLHQHATCKMLHQHATHNMQDAASTCNMQHTTCNTQHAASTHKTQHATHKTQDAASRCNIQHTRRNMLHTTSICNTLPRVGQSYHRACCVAAHDFTFLTKYFQKFNFAFESFSRNIRIYSTGMILNLDKKVESR